MSLPLTTRDVELALGGLREGERQSFTFEDIRTIVDYLHYLEVRIYQLELLAGVRK